MFSIVVYCTGLNVKINCQLILLTLNFAKLTTVFNLNSDIVKKIDQSEFEGFEYINPLLMSAEECV